MTSSTSVRLAAAAAVLATIVACKPSVSVGSPATTASPATRNTATAMPAGVTAASIAEGKTLYETQANNCTRCHGVDGKGTNRGPSLVDSVWVQIDGSYPSIVKIINDGVPAANIKGNYSFNMRPKGGAPLTDAQVASIAAYVWSMSHPR
ncbi:MAG TPA: cytochrome c [Gemmatimonadaceae bacterium]|nr:cytochrome c [Gemmatimonadaceae bacterium]